jgi:hypothetical protein
MQHITKPKCFSPTCLQGYVTAKYSTLIALFGEAQVFASYKTDAEWDLMTPYGHATIYNYKDGKNYLGDEGLPTEEITDWHIGGANKDAVPFIQSIIEAYELNR